MTPLLLLQADSSGLQDLSAIARKTSNNMAQVSVINGYYYYDLAGNTTVKWSKENRLPTETKIITIEGWLYLSAAARNPSINVDILGGIAGGSYSRGFYLGLYTSGELRFVTGNSTRDTAYYPAPPANTAFHFAWVMDGVNKKLYLNGVQVLTAPFAGALENPPNITFGYMNYDNELYAGEYSKAKIHQLIVWNGVKYTGNFTPEHINYEQVQMGLPDDLLIGKIVPADYNGVIADKVLINGVPTERKVAIYRRSTNELVDTTWSDISGNYRFDSLRPNTEYYVLSLDHERSYNAVIQDMIRTDL